MKKRINLITVLLCWATSLFAHNNIIRYWVDNVNTQDNISLIFSTVLITLCTIVMFLNIKKQPNERIKRLPITFISVVMALLPAIIFLILLNRYNIKIHVGVILIEIYVALIVINIILIIKARRDPLDMSNNSPFLPLNPKTKGISIGNSSTNNHNEREINHQNNSNNMDKRYQVFISSTYLDLKKERKKVMEAVLKLNCFPAGMELFPAKDKKMFDYIKQVIDDSDYYVLIIGARYGSFDEDGVSYTEKEYKYAVEQKIPVIAFLPGENYSFSFKQLDKDKTLLTKLEDFKTKVEQENGRLVNYWNNADELLALVFHSLESAFKDQPRRGWVRADQ